MTQPKLPPISLRLPPPIMQAVDAWATDHGLKRHAALVALVTLGLGAPVQAQKAAPVAKTVAPKSPAAFPRPAYGSRLKKAK